MANSLNAVTVSQYADGNGQIQKSYTTIGRAFETKNGWIVRLNALPATSMNDKGILETVILLMPPKQEGQQSRGRVAASGSDDFVPF